MNDRQRDSDWSIRSLIKPHSPVCGVTAVWGVDGIYNPPHWTTLYMAVYGGIYGFFRQIPGPAPQSCSAVVYDALVHKYCFHPSLKYSGSYFTHDMEIRGCVSGDEDYCSGDLSAMLITFTGRWCVFCCELDFSNSWGMSPRLLAWSAGTRGNVGTFTVFYLSTPTIHPGFKVLLLENGRARP